MSNQNGEHDVRIILTGAVLCVLASTTFAAEHYVEVWNPPEARSGGMHAPRSGKKVHAKKVAKHHVGPADHVSPRKVAQPALRASAPFVPFVPAAPSGPATNRHPLIAPKIGPDGHVLQVSYRPYGSHAGPHVLAATRLQ
jgi:hypothetical protein